MYWQGSMIRGILAAYLALPNTPPPSIPIYNAFGFAVWLFTYVCREYHVGVLLVL